MRLDSTILGSVFREKVVANENTSHFYCGTLLFYPMFEIVSLN